jgi:hydroxyacylglutathione hydrolase
MLYDTTADVIRKALRGLDLAPSEAAARCGLSEREVMAATRGPASRPTLLTLGPVLGLTGEALAGLLDYQPPACDLPELRRLELPFDDETVNAWLVEAGASEWLLFDTGNGPADVSRALDTLGIGTVHVLITHSHGDHTGGLKGLGKRVRSLAGPGIGAGVTAGDRRDFGRLAVTALDLPGHCQGAVGYFIEGLARPACVTGDALFAGSIGGCAPGAPYQAALSALRSLILSKPGDTVLLPGHGPESTVASERRGNPFLADHEKGSP